MAALIKWILKQRQSTRLAFGLRAGSLVLTALLSLFWARVLIDAMGKELYGLFITFLAITQLGGLGDLGMGGAVAVRMIRHLARGEEEIGRRFLANARGGFLLLATLLLLVFCILSHRLPTFFNFAALPGTGSLNLLFLLGGIGIACLIVRGYFENLNYILGNVMWPIIPGFVLVQLGFFGQWLAARAHGPLWLQYAPLLAASIVGLCVTVYMIRISHPWMGNLTPIKLDRAETRTLLNTSFWVYFATLGSLVYVATDRILINAGFGPGAVPPYQLNYKLCELSVTLLCASSFVALPAIVVRLLNPNKIEREHGLNATLWLQKLQVFSACVAAIAYLTINDRFIQVWLGADFHVPLALQIAFALNVAVTIAGDVGIQLLGRLAPSAVRIAGLTIGGTGLLNLVLSYAAMKAGWILGIASATVIAQSAASLIMSYHTCRLLGVNWKPWVMQTWLLPLGVIGLAAMTRQAFPAEGFLNLAAMASIFLLLLAAVAWVLGIRREMIAAEWKIIRAAFH
jgi:hypothetical protein